VPRPATVRFYLDEDVRGLAKILAALRNDLTYPGDPGGTVRGRRRPACSITPGTKDPDWIPLVSAQGWLIVTRDLAIQRHTAEITASGTAAPAWSPSPAQRQVAPGTS